MNSKGFWNLFEETGDVRLYLIYRELEREEG